MTKWLDANYSVEATARGFADVCDGKGYCFDVAGDIELAVNVALATDRPLLVRGRSGQGKSALAQAVAFRLNRRYVECVITARSTPDDLLWRVDAVRRLSDAQVRKLESIKQYIEPGALWQAIDPASAKYYGAAAASAQTAARQSSVDDTRPAVLLIDEIDKADPDLPNALLVPLGSWRFEVPSINRVIAAAEDSIRPLVVITSNDERALPNAFERRCIVLDLPDADENRLKQIAKARCPDADKSLIDMVVAAAWQQRERRSVSPAEVIDAILAFDQLRSCYPELTPERVLDHALSKGQ